MNQDIVDELERLRERYDEDGDANRERAYRRAIESIQEYPTRLRSGKEAMKLKWIGKGIGWRVDQVLGTDTVGPKDDDDDSPASANRPMESSLSKPTRQKKRAAAATTKKKTSVAAIAVEESVPRFRAQFVESTARRRPSSSLQPSPQASATRRRRLPPQPSGGAPPTTNLLPSETAGRLLEVVRSIASQITREAHIVLVDAYRRGHQSLSRLVFLVTEKTLPKSTRRGEKLLQQILNKLEQSGLLRNISYQTGVTVGAKGEAHFRSGHSLPAWFICIPACEWPFALLRYTGPWDVWQQLQSAASMKGWRLSSRALLNGYIPVNAMTERDVFRALNLVYLCPTERE